jgi:metalloprotease ARX1
MGPGADAMVAAYVATEAVVSLLSLSVSPNSPLGADGVTGVTIRELVESIAKTFHTKVVPGSRVRRIRRFLAGQSDAVQESDAKGVFWEQEREEARVLGEPVDDSSDEFRVEAGEVWVVDIQMAGTEGAKGTVRLKEFAGYGSSVVRPAIYSRDYTVTYNLKVPAARQLLGRISAETSVYPFKLSYIASDKSELNAARLGLGELVQHYILVPHAVQVAELYPLETLQTSNGLSKSTIKKLVKEVPVAREQATLMLVSGTRSSSGYPEAIRLTGGRTTAPPSWIHSRYEITNSRIQELLALKMDKKRTGISFQVVRPSTYDAEQLVSGSGQDAEMDIDN